MIVLMFAFWVLIMVGLAWAARRLKDRPTRSPDAREILDRRSAAREIDETDYASRGGALTGTRSDGMIDVGG
jgi:hypothetical protein